MENLLNRTDNRRLEFIKLLSENISCNNEWLTLDVISKELDCSSRILKKDILFLNNYYKDFDILTSSKGIKLEYNEHYSIKSFCQKILQSSTAYQLLELIFLNNDLTTQELTDTLDISIPTLYRLINQLNEQLSEEYDFIVETNPFRLVGSEERIRYYFYVYFFERYNHFEWPFEDIIESEFKEFLKDSMNQLNVDVAFSYFNIIKIVSAVNYTRFINGNHTKQPDNKEISPFIQIFIKNNRKVLSSYKTFNGKLLDEKFMQQVFPQYTYTGIFFSVEHFQSCYAEDEKLGEKVNYLRAILNELSYKNNNNIEQLEYLLFGLFNTAYLEYQWPLSGYILYDRNGNFSKDIKQEFRNFYNDLYTGVERFRKFLGKPVTRRGIDFYIYMLFSWWINLVPSLRNKYEKINILVISDRVIGHANMLKNFIEYEFNDLILVEIYQEIDFEPEKINQSNYDLIVSTFVLSEEIKLRNVYIPNLPKFNDYLTIKKHIDDILIQRFS